MNGGTHGVEFLHDVARVPILTEHVVGCVRQLVIFDESTLRTVELLHRFVLIDEVDTVAWVRRFTSLDLQRVPHAVSEITRTGEPIYEWAAFS